MAIGLITFGIVLVLAPVSRGQAPAAAELLRLVPDDMGVCLVVQDLRGFAEKFPRSPWPRLLKDSPLGAGLAGSEEIRKLTKFADELGKLLHTTWPRVRDDIVGDAVVFAYREGGKEESGLVLLKARDPKLLGQLVDRITQEQEKAGELQKLVAMEYKGVQYFRRQEKQRTNFYFLQGPLLALSNQEAVLHGCIGRLTAEKKPGLVGQHLSRAGADRALLALWVNPRAFDGEIQQKIKEAKGPQAKGLSRFLTIWQGLDALVLTFTPDRELEVAVSVLARDQAISPAVQRFFSQASKPSELWQRFPRNALLTIAGRVDATAAMAVLGELVPPEEHKLLIEALQQSAGNLLGLDVIKEILPNLGPDWGLCLATAPNPKEIPHILAALAVRPGDKDSAVDQAMLKGVEVLARLAILNSKHPIRLKTLRQDNVEVHYLAQDKVFPAGIQPAFALKDGYLVLASSPEAIRRFHKRDGAAPISKEALCLRLSLTETSRMLKLHRQKIVNFVAEKNQLPRKLVGELFDGLLAALHPFEHVSLSQRYEPGQITWFLRLEPRRE